MLIASFVTSLVGIFVFLFILWKRLKEDLAPEIIFKLGFTILVGILTGTFLSLKFFPRYFLWASFLGGFLGLEVSVFRLRLKFYEVFESFIIAALPWVGFVFLADSVVHSSLSSFLGFLVILILVFISYYLSAHYKNFGWYKSGKIGFAGMSTLGIVFAIRFILAIFHSTVLSFVGQIEVFISGVGMLVSFLLLLNLGRLKE